MPVVGAVITWSAIAYGAFTGASIISGVGHGIATGDWSRLGNAAELFVGNFYLDENRTFFGGVWQGVSRFSWEYLQTTAGGSYSQIRNTFGKVDRVDFFGGATFSTTENFNSENGISLGNFININIRREIEGDFDTYVLESPLYMHEYGHTFDSQIFGLSYIFSIGLPSFFSAVGGGDHRSFWTETRANRHAARYFRKHFGVIWQGPGFDDFPL